MLPEGGKLIAVFGSAGLRDVEKRRLMAETSARLADFTVLTAEDPRTESLDAILQMMAEGCMAQGGVEGETFIRVPDRGEAIYRACQMAKGGDIVIACGKYERACASAQLSIPGMTGMQRERRCGARPCGRYPQRDRLLAAQPRENIQRFIQGE
jgi:UDP-N-acetylmuramoyl-L-alanyl-D-glutamate--2,6-diaminopimelate ligase